jgi:uncharacterized protein (DUF433 family)
VSKSRAIFCCSRSIAIAYTSPAGSGTPAAAVDSRMKINSVSEGGEGGKTEQKGAKEAKGKRRCSMRPFAQLRQHSFVTPAGATGEYRGNVAAGSSSGYILDVNYQERITINPAIRSGKPCIRGTRVTVADVFDYLGGGMTTPEVLGDFPDVTVCFGRRPRPPVERRAA